MYRKILHLVALCFLTFGLLAQEKGVTPVLDGKETTFSGKTYAVIVGVSEYSDSLIPDLKYADEDARAFATWLMTQKGPNSPSSNIRVLLNEKATGAAVKLALSDLPRVCEKGDRVFLFFSGHSDVERDVDNEPGYFLCYDSPSRVYMNGALNLANVQEITNTLRFRKQCEVILIMDACHAGKLAGELIGGTRHVAESWKKQHQEETKILSCNPDEHSLEGTQWGGGRGVFSYHLVNGLKGLADNHPQDGEVTLLELERYVYDQVKKDVAPDKQSPQVICKAKDEVIAQINPAIRDSMLRGNFDYPSAFNFAENKIVNNDYIFARDTSIKKTFEAFYESLADKRLLSPKGDCAEYHYQIITQNRKVEELHAEITRNFAVALQDDAQVIINEILRSQASRITKSNFETLKDYEKLPSYLERAAALLGPKHYFYNNLKSNQHLFEALILKYGNKGNNLKEEQRLIKELCRKSNQFQEQNVLSYMLLSNLYAEHHLQKDSCLYYFEKAKSCTPTWSLPYAWCGYNLSRYFTDYAQAKSMLGSSLKFDSSNVFVINSLGSTCFYKEEYAEAMSYYQKSILINPDNPQTWLNLAACYQILEQPTMAEQLYKKSIALSPRQTNAYYSLGWLYHEQKQYVLAEETYSVGLQNNTTYLPLHSRLIMLYLDQKLLKKAEEQVSKMMTINEADWRIPFYKSCIAAMKGEEQKALKLLKTASDIGIEDTDMLESRGYFDNLNHHEVFKQILLKNKED